MLFNSLPFIFLFLPISFFVYFYFNRYQLTTAALVWFMLCSLFFYAYWNIAYLPLLLCSIVVNFLIGRFIFNINTTVHKKFVLTVGVIFNIVLLVYFKYTNFMLLNINWLLNEKLKFMRVALPMSFSFFVFGPIMYKFGVHEKRRLLALSIGCLVTAAVIMYYNHAETLLGNTKWFMENKLHASQIILPIGISFFTFTQIAFLVDVYQRKAAEYRLLHYTLFVSYFPHLLSGPIIHHSEMMPQFTDCEKKSINYNNIYKGIFLFSIGLFKKVVVADTFGIWANSGYSNVHHLSIMQAWASVLSYTFQLYFDFSGYTDMAIGLSWMFNIELPINFNSPYKSLNIREFWQRWHITLSRFLKNYLYIIIGGNRASDSKVLRNFLIVFLIGGIWHGAGWTFVIWGCLHGVAMSIRKVWQKTNIVLSTIIAWFITFIFINITWVYFRAKTFDQANTMLASCFKWHTFSMINPLILLSLLFGFFICVFSKNSNQLALSEAMSWKITPVLIGSLFLLSLYVLIIRDSSAFLYFQF